MGIHSPPLVQTNFQPPLCKEICAIFLAVAHFCDCDRTTTETIISHRSWHCPWDINQANMRSMIWGHILRYPCSAWVYWSINDDQCKYVFSRLRIVDSPKWPNITIYTIPSIWQYLDTMNTSQSRSFSMDNKGIYLYHVCVFNLVVLILQFAQNRT